MASDGSSEQLYGGETRKAIENFKISGEVVPPAVIHWLGRIKGAAAEVNGELGLLDPAVADAISGAAREIAEGKHDAAFPIDVFQTGSGTSSNMNANEVIATLAGDGAHPNDHVNLGQSSNDVFPSAVHLAALEQATRGLVPALEALEETLTAKAASFHDIVKAGRTHLMDAVPVTLGQEFAGYAAQVRLGRKRVEAALPHVAQIPLGGTATGTGLNTHPEFAAKVDWIEADAFELLRDYADADSAARFDTIVLDPPAFAKSKRAAEGALRGYKELNLRALKMLSAGGTLVTCSCSHHVGMEEFVGVVRSAAEDTGRRVQLLEMRGAAPDHPAVLTLPETSYLKCLICRVG